MELNEIYLYRITHIKNVPHILKFGITHRLSPNHNEDFIPIGDRSLIGFRSTKTILTKGITITLGDVIPFYFGVRMPMLYVIQHGFNSTTPIKPDDIVYIAIPLKKIIDDPHITFFFTDGHATDFLTTFYDKSDIPNLINILDWQAIKTFRWSGNGIDADLKRRKQAEFLIQADIPSEYIHGFICYNEYAQRVLIDYGVKNQIIKVIPNAYY